MKKILITLLLILFALYVIANLHVFAADRVDVPGCRHVKHPVVCAQSYHKCDNIGLDQACLQTAQLDGFYGYDVMKAGDKPVYSGDK